MELLGIAGLVLWALYYFVGEWVYGAPVTYSGRLRMIAGAVAGQVVNERSSVGGHVIWSRRGLPFYFYERAMVPQRWTILSVGYDGMRLPLYQLRAEGSVPLPLLPPPRRVEFRTGNPEFDGRFVLRAPQGTESPEVPPLALRRFQDIAALLQPDEPMLEVHLNRVRLYLPGVLRGADRRNRAIEFGCQLLEAVLMGKGHEVTSHQLKVVDIFSSGTGAQCRVCSETIAEAPVQCAKCGAPHHRECWEYIGACAIYGCGGTKCRA